MRTYKRRRHLYLFAILLGLIGVLNLLFFFILYSPVRSEYFRLQESIQRARTDVLVRQQKIDRLEKLSAQLEHSAQDRFSLVTMHFIPRDRGWSQILPKLDAMVQSAGVKNERTDYVIAETPQFGLYSVKIRLPVSGLYPNVVNLIKALENSDTFFIIDSIDVRGNAGPGAPDVAMNLNLETFFYK